MLRSLVGSEMCIRDSVTPETIAAQPADLTSLTVTFDLEAPDAEEVLYGCGCVAWIYEFTSLVSLHLPRFPFTELPQGLERLTKLEELVMYGSRLHRLPRSIGKLQALSNLDLYTSYTFHYLPYEILGCQNLSHSCFSTRALFNNSSNRMCLPELVSPKDERVVSMVYVSLVLRRLFEDRHLRSLVFQLIDWDTCSVCGSDFVRGCASSGHVWSHTNVATDDQSLLATCCSLTCADQIQNQVRFSPVVGRNESRVPENASQAMGYAWRPEKSPKYGRVQSTFTDAHLMPQLPQLPPHGSLWSPSTGVDVLPKWSGEVDPAEVLVFKVLRSGDLRRGPSSESECLGRVEEGMMLLVHQGLTDDHGRVWVRLGTDVWTAITKKDGKSKLEYRGAYSPGQASSPRGCASADLHLDPASLEACRSCLFANTCVPYLWYEIL
eukprot:TRINITY_DN17275_c0_g1_i2.p1 TRINITY_DN17275_c0_g1~~TRINITY_DN17275_c0_g1_i2.p1  ORF type:complete len:482 (+),score=47.27 TRINITY_DN17275_c0_g1_i2:138-1448(+)